MRALRFAVLACAAAGWLAASPANAQTPAAEAAAAAFCDGLDSGDLGQVYDQELGPIYQALMPRKNFIDFINVARIQAGGPHLGRVVIGETPVSQLPTGQTGDFYYVRFKTTFHTGTVFQDIYLQNLGGAWKVIASLASPAPAG
ncbi:MAG TPA: hypothetical protein VGI95_00190 [Caulobacteraceae bacterium]|jgi:hypothetical protein